MKLTSLLLLLFLAFQGIGQGIYTETEIAAQDLLIAAKKEVLLGDVDKAVDIYKNLLSEHNELAAAYELSRIYVKNEDLATAQKYARRAYEGDRTNQWYLIQFTDILAVNGDDKQAADLFAAFSAEDPNNDYHYLQASYHYLRASQPKEAIAILDKLEKNNGVNEQVIQRKFEIYDVMGKEKDALKELQKLHSLYPKETRHLHNIAGYLRTIGKDNDANKIMAQILEIDPDDESAILFASSSGKNKDANYLLSLVPVVKDNRIELDKKIIELIPYVQDYAEKQDAELGESLLNLTNILDEAYPNNAKVKSLLGDIYFYKKDLKAAADNYARSVESEKSTWSVWSQLFISLNFTKDYDRMKDYSEEAIDVYPNQALTYFYNSLSLMELGDLEEAQSSASEAKMVSGNNPIVLPEIYLLESMIKYKQKKFEESLGLVAKAVEISNVQNPRIFDHLGDVQSALNDLPSAKAAWKKAIKAGGSPERINKKIRGEAVLNN